MSDDRLARLRREPPAFVPVTVRQVRSLSPRLRRVTLTGDGLDVLVPDLPAASVRLLLPPPGQTDVVVPRWNGNEFLLPDGSRPAIRTLTPRRVDPEAGEVDVDVVVHEGGVASRWAATATPGDPAALSGPGRGYAIDPAATDHLLAGDESAIPAISQLLEHLPETARVQVVVEVAAPEARLDLPTHLGATVHWVDLPPGSPPGTALVDAVVEMVVDPDATRVWVAGEAAAVQRIRRHLFDDLGMSRRAATVRGYWKQGRGGDDPDDS